MSRRQHLRTRVTLSFLLASVPAVAISIGAVIVIDRLIASEIEQRADETFRAVNRGLRAEKERVQRALRRVARDDSLVGLANDIDHQNAVERAEALAPLLAAEAGLSVFGIVAARGPDAGTIVSSAHLSTSAGDPAPPFASPKQVRTSTAGFVQELIAGNPPRSVPVMAAVHSLNNRSGQRALIIYGGRRLDGSFLGMLARMRGASLLLHSPGQDLRAFPPELEPAQIEKRPLRTIGLKALPGGIEDLGPKGVAAPRIEVAFDTARLENARRRFVLLAIGLIIAVIAGAVLAGAWLSKPITEPILELSRAAERVGSGDLHARVQKTQNDEVGELVDVFNQMVAEIADSRESLARAERIAAWRHAARQVAHEIKNPLTPMRMAMETLRKAYKVKHKQLDAIVDESTTAVLDEVRALSRIVSEFSEFARLPKPKLEAIAALELLESTSRLYGTTPDNIEVTLDLDSIRQRELPILNADREQIGRALINLVKNAIEAMAEGGTVTLDAHAARRQGREGVHLAVTDTGPGIPDEVREKLFAPYFTTKQDGTGLGLAIVERIVAEHEGTIEVQSNDDGTEFRLWLPAA